MGVRKCLPLEGKVDRPDLPRGARRMRCQRCLLYEAGQRRQAPPHPHQFANWWTFPSRGRQSTTSRNVHIVGFGSNSVGWKKVHDCSGLQGRRFTAGRSGTQAASNGKAAAGIYSSARVKPLLASARCPPPARGSGNSAGPGRRTNMRLFRARRQERMAPCRTPEKSGP